MPLVETTKFKNTKTSMLDTPIDKQLFLFNDVSQKLSKIDEWLLGEPDSLFQLARHWFEELRGCGEDVYEIIHDGMPTACVDNAAFAYVNVFKSHANLGFFTGAFLADPAGLLEGTGKRMRHVKLRPGEAMDKAALSNLVQSAYFDVRQRLGKV